MEPLRILIADDHPLFRNGMRALLSSVPEIEVAGIATNGDEVMSLAASLLPDVILMDLQMPGIGGIEATRRILHTSPHIRVLVVTMFEDDHSVFADCAPEPVDTSSRMLMRMRSYERSRLWAGGRPSSAQLLRSV
jgi:DNA-binding NarL/FixJ family response regulator